MTRDTCELLRREVERDELLDTIVVLNRELLMNAESYESELELRDAITRTWSWRITAPLRALRRRQLGGRFDTNA